jgi:hypothetical protein
MNHELAWCHLDINTGILFITSRELRKVNDELIGRWFPGGLDRERHVQYSEVFPVAAIFPSMASKVMYSPLVAGVILDQIRKKWGG